MISCCESKYKRYTISSLTQQLKSRINYKDKIAPARVVADQLDHKVDLDIIKSSLESEGLYNSGAEKTKRLFPSA